MDTMFAYLLLPESLVNKNGIQGKFAIIKNGTVFRKLRMHT